MKKIVYILMAMLMTSFASFAQTTTTPKAAASKTAVKPASGKATATKTKKDGTPDMRVKANKAAAKPAGPLKKDGTPDMRYKANKDAAKK